MNKKIRRVNCSLVILSFVLLVPAGFAQGRPTRVRFPRGRSSVTLRGRIFGFETKDYVLGARAGQVMSLHLTSPNQYTNFTIYSINGHPTDVGETSDWSGRLAESGDYVIRVLIMRAGARQKGSMADYRLRVRIQ